VDAGRVGLGRLRSRFCHAGEESIVFGGLFVGGLAMTALSLLLLWTTPHPFANLTLTAGSLGLFLTGLLAEDVPAIRRTGLRLFLGVASALQISPLQSVGLPIGLLLSLASWSASGNGPLAHLPGAWATWMIGIAVTGLSLWRRRPALASRAPDLRTLALWLAILLAAVAVRILALGDIPAAVTGDEGSVGLVGWEFASGLRTNLFPSSWHSLPSLYFAGVSIFQRVLGARLDAIRLTSVVGGILSVVAIYWAADKILGRTAAVIAMLSLAFYSVHILFSRIATAAVWDGVFFSGVLGGLWSGAAKGERSGFLLAGLAAGLSHYFHPVSRLILLYALGWSILFLPTIRRERRLAGLWAGALVALVVLLPLALYYATVPLEYLAPLRAISVTGDTPLLRAITQTPEAILPLLTAQLRTSLLGIFALPLDGVYTPGRPLLLPLPAALVGFGLILTLVRAREPRLSALWVPFVGALTLGMVSIEAPNVELLQSLAPAAAMLIALPLSEGLTWAQRLGQSARLAALALVAGLLVLMVGLDARQTLAERPPFRSYAGPTASLAWAMGDTLVEVPQGTPIYLFGSPWIAFSWEPGLAYMASGLETHDMLWPVEGGPALPSAGTPAVFLFAPEQLVALDTLRAAYPDGRVDLYRDPSGEVRFARMEVGF
jgi:4-amino-4-deoxy-L-arabinose transferase-like glycosyltransferase